MSVKNTGNVNSDESEQEIRIYFENSGSLKGYVGKDALDFKNSLINAIGELKLEFKDNIKLYFVNDDKMEGIQGDVMTFCNQVDISTFKGASSRMELMIPTILDSTRKNVLSVFVSDCIFSIGNKQDAVNELAQVKGIIKDKVFAKIQQLHNSTDGFGIRMYKMMCDFNGNYFNSRNTPIQLEGVKRPIYFLTMGPTELLKKIKKNEHLIFRKSDGFTQSIECNSIDYNNYFSFENSKSYVSLLQSTNKIGKYRTRKNNDRVVEITELEPSKNRDGATFQVALALNLDEVPVSEEYKLNPINYSTNNKDGYRIVEIKKIEDIILNPKDKELLSSQDKAKPFKATHVVVIASNEKGFPPIQLKMHRKMSDSLKSSYGTFADDENVKSSLTKTFGLEYLVTGFEEAFSRKSNEGNGEYLYFNLTIPISTGSSSAGGWIVAFIVLLIVGFGVFLVLKNKKR